MFINVSFFKSLDGSPIVLGDTLFDCEEIELYFWKKKRSFFKIIIYFGGGGKLGLAIANGTPSVSVQIVGGLEFRSVPLSDILESSSSGFTSESSTNGTRSFSSFANGRIVGDGCGSVAASQTCFISLKVESLDRREQKTCLSSSVVIATAFGMIRAVFSLLIFNTEIVGINSFVT